MSLIIGLHNHINSLSRENMLNFLDECLISNANIISITDHRTLSSYYYLFSLMSDEELAKYKDLKFVIGMELTGSFPYQDVNGETTNIVMDILNYNIDIDKYYILWNFIQNNYSNYMDTREFQKEELSRLIRIAQECGFKADYEKLEINDQNPFAARVISYALIDHKYVDYNLKQGLLPEIVTNPRSFFNRYCKTKTPFYLDTSVYFPSIQEVINAIGDSNGLPFLDHPAAYFPKSTDEKANKTAWENSKKFVLDFYYNTTGVKGLEIVHPSFLSQTSYYNFLTDYSKKNHLYVSGGTDYHKNGEPITVDYSGRIIDDQRLYNFNEWAKVYNIYELKEIGNMVFNIEKPKILIK